ncbi:MAG: SMC-Scp complex subunit ScpB [Planctomycetota bacterium]
MASTEDQNENTTDPAEPSEADMDVLTEDGHPQWDMDPESCRRRVEAVLFLSRNPLTSRKIAQLAGLEDGTRARTLIGELNSHYDEVGRAFHIKRIAGGYQMLTRPQFARWIRRQEHIKGFRRLSSPMLETLTVVAYRQPIIKAEIEAIRGVSCGEILRQLLEKGLVKIAGRSPELGRPFLYATSRKFLAEFGLNSLSDLPRAAHLGGAGLPQWAVTVDNSNPSSGDPGAGSSKSLEQALENTDNGSGDTIS